jgi:hypothetical protein
MSLILSGTDGLSDVDGSAATPAIRGTDANTGIFFPAADTIAFAEGGVESMRIDASGNMGLGVTPSAWSGFRALDVGSRSALVDLTSAQQTDIWSNGYFNGTNSIYKTTANASIYRQTTGQHIWYNAPSGTAGNAITFTQAMTLDASGNLSIGATSTTGKLLAAGAGFNILGNAYGVATFLQDTTTARGVFMGYDSTGQIGTVSASSNGAASNLAFWTYSGSAWAERARIDSSGNLLVGRTTTANTTVGSGLYSYGLIASSQSASTNANTSYDLYSTGAAAYRFYVGMGGTIYATSTTISAISDIRFKENVRDLDAGLSEVMALKPRLYDWKEGKGADTKNARGFIAQEFEEVFPDLIDEWKDPAPEGEEPYKSVRQDLIPVLVKAIQEQQALITQLTARISALESA